MMLTGFLYMLKSIVLILIEDSSNSTKLAVTKLPFRVEYGYKIDQYFYPILVHCYLTVFSHVTATVAADTLYISLVQHACGMFSVVGHSLENIGKDSDASFILKPDKIKDDNYSEALKCLRKHLDIIKFAELIESTFTKIFLVSISLNMVGGSICGIQVLINLNDAKDIIAPLAIYIAQLGHLFLQFWQAQFLLDYSAVPYESICRGNWYNTSDRCRKLLLLIMSRTILPCRITAGKVVTLSIETFSVVLKTSMSYFTMLRRNLHGRDVNVQFSQANGKHYRLQTIVRKVFLKMAERKDIWQSRYYTIPRAYMRLIGIWPYHAIHIKYLLFVPMFTFSVSILVPQLLYLIIAAANLDDVFSSTPSIWITIIFSFKIASLMANNRKLETCLKTIEDDWSSLNTDAERVILQQHTAYGRYITLTYGVFMQFVGILLIIKSFAVILIEDTSDATISTLVAGSKLPFRVEYGEKLGQYLYPMAIHCYLAVFAHISITIAVDSFYIVLVRHACGMFAIVGHTLEHIGKDSDDSFELKPDKVKDHNYSRALSCLRRHLHVIQFAELIESTFSNIFLVSVCLNMIGGSMIGIQVILNLNDAKDIVEPLAIYIAQLIHLFLQFWPAQFLLDYSIVPYESICKSDWYYTSGRCRKLLFLIMNRSVLPCKVTAGKVVTLSIESFGTVLKTSMSYLTMLRSFN
nr:PREDICTED: odorant receptor 13a-like [Linepithema humile]